MDVKKKRFQKFPGKTASIYFDGSYTKIHRLIQENPELIASIEATAPNFDASYVKSIMDVPDEDQHTLLIER